MTVAPMMKTASTEQRREERVAAELPVELGSAQGITKNVSATGIFFETDTAYSIGGTVDFAVELATPGGKMKMRCRGEIVRIEPREARVGVAVKITESMLVAGEQGAR
jgi:Tfp pilus assembly protein PilZ